MSKLRGLMIPFSEKFPKLAERETRTVTLLNECNVWNLPAGKYVFLESYCGDPKCDCRHAFINVGYVEKSCEGEDKLRILATIGYGWDTLDYYSTWFGSRDDLPPDEDIVRDFKGPVLEIGGVFSKHSLKILKLFKDIMLNDAVFIQRLKKHYRLFKGY